MTGGNGSPSGGGPGGTAYGEPVTEGFDHAFTGRLVHTQRSEFQLVEVFDHPHFGRMLVLDGLIQTSERDEFCYHEMLVHPAMLSVPSPERSLVIGGGDGGTLRRMLEHPGRAEMCEIDRTVTDVSVEHLPSVSAGAITDTRATVVFDDGAAYVASHEATFDVIAVDSTDPIGPAVVLFSEAFYADCRRALRPGGVVVAQSGSPMYQGAELQAAYRNMREVFEHVEVYLGFVPTYPGVLWSFLAGTDGPPPSACAVEVLEARMRDRKLETRFYTPEVHAAAFALPAFVRDLLEEARDGAPPRPASVPRG